MISHHPVDVIRIVSCLVVSFDHDDLNLYDTDSQFFAFKVHSGALCSQDLEQPLRYQRSERRLRAGMMGKPRTAKLADAAAASVSVQAFTSKGSVDNILGSRCWAHGQPHQCLDQFKAMPSAVRNWRILWVSLPKPVRKEFLAKALRQGVLNMFLGQRVCLTAFQMLTGVGGSTLQALREAIRKGQVSFSNTFALAAAQSIKNLAKSHRYIDAREWLEVYAETHAEQSPMTGIFHLPSARRSLYYELYVHDRTQSGGSLAHLDGKPADYVTFREMWRHECGHIVIAKSESMFIKCGVCEYLKGLLASIPSGKGNLEAMVRQRLGAHFSFQSSQRLAVGRMMEHARRSCGAHWLMKIDKMDQKRTILPVVWSQHASALFKQGSRLVVGLNGSQWCGLKTMEYHLRTVHEDCRHGASMQSTTILLNFHGAVLREGHVPERFTINADNTPKETKNGTTFIFAAWLLSVLSASPLHTIEFAFLMVGHTHDSLDPGV